jgi:hypothetical protein
MYNSPAFVGAGLSQDVYLNSATPLTVIGSGGGGSLPATASFSTVILAPPNTYVEGLILDNTAGGNDGAQILFKTATADPDFTMFYDFGADAVSIRKYTTGNVLPLLDGALKVAALVNVSTINGVVPGGGAVSPELTLSTLNVSSFAITSSIVTNEITAVASLTIQPAVNVNILASSGNAQLASVNLDTTINSGRATNIYSSGEINIQSAVSTNMTAQLTKINSSQSTIMNSPQTYISSTNIYCDGGEGTGGAIVSATPYTVAFPLGTAIFSSLAAQPGAVGYAWPMFTLEQYQKISTVCGF